MTEYFGTTTKTLINWDKGEGGRKILYEVLKSLPIEYVEKIKTQYEERLHNENLLNHMHDEASP